MTEFELHFREIAKRFLKNAVLIDDQAFVGTDKAERIVHESVELQDAERKPVEDDAAADDEPPVRVLDDRPSPDPRVDEALVNPDAIAGHDLDAREVIDQFSALGIFCSLIIPGQLGPVPHQELIKSADIVILDWWIHNDSGDRALQLIRAMAADGGFQRIRLIGIYTGRSTERELAQIVDEIIRVLRSLSHGYDPQLPDPFTIVAGAFRVVIYGKRHAEGRSVGFEPRLKTWREIPEQMVDDFARSAAGLVPGVVLQSLSTLREHSWKVLSAFDASLDGAYLWHRAALNEPGDAEVQLLAMITAELEAILLDSECGSGADIDAITKWLSDNDAKWADRFGIVREGGYTTKDVIALLRIGCARVTKESKELVEGLNVVRDRRKRRPFYWGHPAFSTTSEEMTAKNILLAQRSSLKTIYGTPSPKLHLGTVLRHGDGPEKRYWICLQPLCDSERIHGRRSFPLCPLKVAGDGALFDLAVTDGSAEVMLSYDLSPYDIEMVCFPSAADGGAVIAVLDERGHTFTSEDSRTYLWLAELKPAHAARLAQRFADRLGRVGLDESEWLRLSSGA